MSTCSSAFLTIFLLYLSPTSFAQDARDPPGLQEVLLQFKRFGTECLLSDGVNKGNSKEVLNKIMDIDTNLLTCYRHTKSTYNSENKPDREENPSSNARLTRQVKAYCKIANELTDCLDPILRDLFIKHKHIDGIAFLGLAKHVCRKDGSTVVEFLTAMRESCSEAEFKNPKVFHDCLDRNFNSKVKDNNVYSYVSQNTCKATSDFKDCGLIYLNQCKSQEPKTILEKYLNELKKESPEAEKCFLQDSMEQQGAQIQPATASTKKPAKLKGSGKRKHTRPKFIW